MTDLLVKPMQRLTRYSLLLKAILRKTDCESEVLALKRMVSQHKIILSFTQYIFAQSHQSLWHHHHHHHPNIESLSPSISFFSCDWCFKSVNNKFVCVVSFFDDTFLGNCFFLVMLMMRGYSLCCHFQVEQETHLVMYYRSRSKSVVFFSSKTRGCISSYMFV